MLLSLTDGMAGAEWKEEIKAHMSIHLIQSASHPLLKQREENIPATAGRGADGTTVGVGAVLVPTPGVGPMRSDQQQEEEANGLQNLLPREGAGRAGLLGCECSESKSSVLKTRRVRGRSNMLVKSC